MTIQAYLRVMRRHWLALLACTALGLIGAVALTAVMPKVYVATTTQFVRGIPSTGTSAYQSAQMAISRAGSYSVLIGNPDVLAGIVSDLNLNLTPGEVYSRLSVTNPTDTALINVTARGRTADEAQALSIAAADNLARLIIRLESANIAGGESLIDIQTAVPALKPTSPASPRLVLNVAVGITLGLAVGSTVALALDSRQGSSRPQPRPTKGAGERGGTDRHPGRRSASAAENSSTTDDELASVHTPGETDVEAPTAPLAPD